MTWPNEPLRTRAGEEMADVLLYLVLLADVLGVDLAAAARAKMDDSERRFPPGAVTGTAPVASTEIGGPAQQCAS